MHLSLASLVTAVSSASATIYYAGVAESGGEFGVYSANATNGTGLPGRFNVDYAFLNASTVPIWVQQNKVSNTILNQARQLLASLTNFVREDQRFPRRLPPRAHVPSSLRSR